MFDMEARRMIEALRSGIPSRAVGRCFSEARPEIMKEITKRLDTVRETGHPDGFIICGKYGEGKTHLLNTVFGMAHDCNMAVSFLSLSKETPVDKLYLVYQKLIANTYLPGRRQPGFLNLLDGMTLNSPMAGDLCAYAAKELETDKLYYLLRAYLSTEDQEERFLLEADLEGDFIANGTLKKIYKRIFNQTAKFSTNFTKSKHTMDYFRFMSHLFLKLGYQGWVILIDETELMGRLGKKARLNGYNNMANFLLPDNRLESVFSMFAMSASYGEDVIEGKHELENLSATWPENQEPAKTVIRMITKAPQLLPLTQEETRQILSRIQELHGRAYGWTPQVSPDTIFSAVRSGGYLLRTRIRAAIEFLDQLYQYGEAGKTKIDELGRESFEEDVPSLDELETGRE